ncbi:FadR/GntR family transcriptional regulator [Novosphingobium rosa]|uniref:FadR/GntR family transcriptional regulator n=1 Tax=Novosphingobium rosa TaxID=76978 RepID=UPI000835B4D1|nr:FadR/GntR family transcriptional regulator [Novosphingobium rosa]
MTQPPRPRRLADEAYAGIVQLIVSEDLQLGARLPSETHLAERLGVSRAIIREALARLQSDGLTQARVGSGSYVTRRPDRLLARHLPLDEIAAAFGTYEVRFVLEPEAARLAALRHGLEDMAGIMACLDALKQALLSGQSADGEDMALHRAIMVASGNIAFVAAFDALAHGTGQIMRAGVDIARSRPPEIIRTMLSEHEEIVEAIHLRDGERAALTMRWHLSQGRRRLTPIA